MKKNIHPAYNSNATVTCACGNTFKTGSVKDEISIEICNACHPFYTGSQNLVDNEGRVKRYQDKVAKAKVKAEEHAKMTKAKKERKAKADKEQAA